MSPVKRVLHDLASRGRSLIVRSRLLSTPHPRQTRAVVGVARRAGRADLPTGGTAAFPQVSARGAGGARTHDPGILRTSGLTLVLMLEAAGVLGASSYDADTPDFRMTCR